jgi:hypothetical protein
MAKTTKKPTKRKSVKKPSKYNVLITVKTVVGSKVKAMKMKRDAAKKLKGSKVKVTKAR